MTDLVPYLMGALALLLALGGYLLGRRGPGALSPPQSTVIPAAAEKLEQAAQDARFRAELERAAQAKLQERHHQEQAAAQRTAEEQRHAELDRAEELRHLPFDDFLEAVAGDGARAPAPLGRVRQQSAPAGAPPKPGPGSSGAASG